MKLSTVNVLVSLFGALTLNPAMAASQNELLWTNQGFAAAKDCRVVERNEIPFRVAILRRNVLVKIEGPSELRPDQDVRATIVSSADVTSSNLNKEITTPKMGLADLRDQVLEIRPGAPALSIGKTRVIGTFWQAAMNGEKYLSLECGKKSYVLFDVFTKDSVDPIAQVGVNADTTQILRSALAHKSEDAEKEIQEQQKAEAERQNAQMLAATSVKTNLVTKPKATEKPQTPKTVAPLIPAEKPKAAPAVTVTSAIEYVVCVKDEGLQVRSKNLKEVLFVADKLDAVKPLQSFGGEQQSLIVNGVKHSFINVKFDRPGTNTGWVAESYVKLKSECPYAAKKPVEQSKEEKKREQSREGRDLSKITSLKDSNCCDFPVKKRPTRSYLEGQRRFRAGRGGRLHAACDLYRVKNEDVAAIAPGTVLRKYSFYQGTDAIEIVHPGGFVVRYGEVTTKNAAGTAVGAKVKAGQVVGFVGKVNSGCCEPMLHFELYSGSSRGPLTVRSNAFQRRSDLINPTAYLQRWEKAKFGQSY